MAHNVETLVIGAGLIGSSVAFHLARLGMAGIRVVEFDLEGSLSSSELNAGGVRATFSQPINIEASKITIDFFAAHAEEVGYRSCGYLWLHTPESLGGALKARELQCKMGWPVEAWDVRELTAKIPFLDKTDDLVGALFAPRDGLVNPNLLKSYFRSEARKLGVVFDDGTLVRSAQMLESGYELDCIRFDSGLGQDSKRDILSAAPGQVNDVHGSPVRYQTSRVINCAGPWAMEIARILGYACPSYAVRRQVCIFDCRDVDLTPYGMIVDTSGVYFHPEATNGLAGVANHNEPQGINFQYEGDSFFMEQIWPALFERSSKFEKLRHMTGWAGQYEVSPDESAIVGQVEVGDAGRSGRVFEAHSFSGHGVMHSYAAGLAMAEKIVLGRYETWDASLLAASRFGAGRLLRETAVI